MIDAKTLQRAIEFAVKAHKGAFRKGDKRPYIMHPLSVMNRIQTVKKSSNAMMLAAAAVLHDTVEDCGVELDEIAKEFGYYVAGLVEELTLDKSKYETIGKTNYLCQELTKMSSYALCIKLCDRLDNVEDMVAMNEDFVTKYTNETHAVLSYVVRERPKLTKTHVALIAQIQQVLREQEHEREEKKKALSQVPSESTETLATA